MSNFKKYPNLYLLTESTADWHGRSFYDFLSGVLTELQVNSSQEPIATPAGLELWCVYVNDRRLTHVEVDNAIGGNLKQYRAGNFSFFLPEFTSLKEWMNDAVVSVKLVNLHEHGGTWIVSGPDIPQCKLSIHRVKLGVVEAVNLPYSLSKTSVGRISIDGSDVLRFDVGKDADGDVLLKVSTELEHVCLSSDVGEVVKRMDRSVTFPITVTSYWKQAILEGEMVHCRLKKDDTVYTISFQFATLEIHKPKEDEPDNTLAAYLWNECIPEWQKEIARMQVECNARSKFMELLEDTTYSMTVSGATAVRGTADGDAVTIFVQDKGIVTVYEVSPTLSCHECNADGEFKFTGASTDNAQYIFRAGLKNKATGECSPVLVIFDKN